MARDKDAEEGEESVYGGEAREELMDAGEISPEEEAFMEGYDSAEREEDDSASDAYEQAFAQRRAKKRSRRDEEDEEDGEFDE